MAMYEGRPFAEDDLSLTSVELSEVLRALKSEDFASEINKWANLAPTKDDILYFGIAVRGEVVGQVFLHDWDRQTKTSLVGYHLYRQETRGGVLALKLYDCCCATSRKRQILRNWLRSRRTIILPRVVLEGRTDSLKSGHPERTLNTAL
jgi:hypothetical protein